MFIRSSSSKRHCLSCSKARITFSCLLVRPNLANLRTISKGVNMCLLRGALADYSFQTGHHPIAIKREARKDLITNITRIKLN